MKLTIPFIYHEMIVPPRCRKPRPTQFEDSLEVELPEISSRRAPIAIAEHTRAWTGEKYGPVVLVYRWYQNRLWGLWEKSDASGKTKHTQSSDEFKLHYYSDCYQWENSKHQPRANVKSIVQKWARGALFLDGLRWESVGEPRYVVMTFGLGNNHGLGGGTALMTSRWYNPNISWQRYFRIDQRREAIAEAARIAKARGDTKALPIKPDSHFEIRIPAAIRLNPKAEHGDGDPFINKMEGIIESVEDSTIAGMLGMVLALKGD